MNITENEKCEYWFHVADQKDIPIAGVVESPFDIDSLYNFISEASTASFNEDLKSSLENNIDLLDVLRTLVGVSNKRLYLELSLLFGRTYINERRETLSGDSVFNLSKHDLKFFKKLSERDDLIGRESLDAIANYLIDKDLQDIIFALKGMSKDTLLKLVTHLIFPKEIQQKEAKRRGHGAEQALAKLLNELSVGFLPSDRHSDPMKSQDPNVSRLNFSEAKKEKGKTWSFDVIAKDAQGIPSFFVQSLIHTSDPGQYGVNKSDETILVKEDLNKFNLASKQDYELWGFVDGFGFSENKKDTIDKMLNVFDCFIQMNSLYKAGLRLHSKGVCKIKAIEFDDTFYSDEDIKSLSKKYVSNDILILNSRRSENNNMKAIVAGKATLFI